LFDAGLLDLLPLADPLPIAATLLTAALAAALRLPPDLIGMPTTPTLGGILTCRTAIPSLAVFGFEEPLAAFQQAATLPRPPTGALP
jgi:hypothetical protein